MTTKVLLSKGALKELKRIAAAGNVGLLGCLVNLTSAPALVRRGLVKIEMDVRRPYYVVTDSGLEALHNENRHLLRQAAE